MCRRPARLRFGEGPAPTLRDPPRMRLLGPVWNLRDAAGRPRHSPGGDPSHSGSPGASRDSPYASQTFRVDATGPLIGTDTAGPAIGTVTAGPLVETDTTGLTSGTDTFGPVVGTDTTGPPVGTDIF